MVKTSISIGEELLEEVNDQLSYGDNRSAWIRDAIEMKLAVVDELEGVDEEMTEKERREFVVKAVRSAGE
jgi:metal-responsive CopG/Arc/MetJ family transcriptional regulator